VAKAVFETKNSLVYPYKKYDTQVVRGNKEAGYWFKTLFYDEPLHGIK
jgi:hypothetical protein